MPKNDSTIQFSLPKEIRDKLADRALVTGRDEEGNEIKESIGQTAKRLVISALGIEAGERGIDHHRVSDLEALVNQITSRVDRIEDFLTPDNAKDDEPPTTSGNHSGVYVVYTRGQYDLVPPIMPSYWGGKAGWVRDRSAALTFDTESKARGQVTRSRKKYPDRSIDYLLI